MSAASDYQQAVRVLAKPLPAYVTYVQSGYLRMDAVEKDLSETITVRTSDGKIVKGKSLDFNIGVDKKTEGSIIRNSPFDAGCYTGASARSVTFEGREVEAIALKDSCEHDKDQGDFSTLYVDPATHDPLAAVGQKKDDPVDVRIEQHFARTGAYVLPAQLAVRVKGSGLMFWLDVDVHLAFSAYRFSDKLP
jgi:hypothetical protein